MDVIFANPAGFWALLGLPAVLAIHFLQRQARTVTISTLFLLDQLQKQSLTGRRVERLRSSIPLWLQLLMVLLLTWLLVDPRWIREDSVQRIAVVMDGSASMQVFKEDMAGALDRELSHLETVASQTEYVMLDSRILGESLYHGPSRSDLIASLPDWQPLGGDHDFTPALRVARSLVGQEGVVILATDHELQNPAFDARVLSTGRPTANCGFAGMTVEQDESGQWLWKALVRNYSDQPQTRQWFLQSGGQKSAPRSVSLEPNQLRSLSGAFPGGGDAAMLILEGDSFALDDRLPLVRPIPKPLALGKNAPRKLDRLLDPLMNSLENVTPPGSGEVPDVTLASYDPLQPAIPAGNLILFVDQARSAGGFLDGRIAAENHPLTEGLNWQGLITQNSPSIPVTEQDEVLLWQGGRPLILLRIDQGARQLILNFELARSNASRLPAFVILVSRFLEDIRDRKVAPEHRNFETGQAFQLAHAIGEDAGPLLFTARRGPLTSEEEIPLNRAATLRAPAEPAFFDIRQDGVVLLEAAAYFADTREADLTSAAPMNNLREVESQLTMRHAEKDSHWQFWALLVAMALLASWFFIHRPTTTSTTAQPA